MRPDQIALAAAAAALLIGGAGFLFWLDRYAVPGAHPERARALCRNFIREHLHSPGSVEWIGRRPWPVTAQGWATWRVQATYRAANAFGALCLGITTCLIRDDGHNPPVLLELGDS